MEMNTFDTNPLYQELVTLSSLVRADGPVPMMVHGLRYQELRTSTDQATTTALGMGTVSFTL